MGMYHVVINGVHYKSKLTLPFLYGCVRVEMQKQEDVEVKICFLFDLIFTWASIFRSLLNGVCVFQAHSPITSWHMSFDVSCHYNKTHILWLPFMTALSHKIPKYDRRGTGGGWRAQWLGLVITDESLWTSIIWIYTAVWAYKRTKSTVPIAHGHALTGLGVGALLWPSRAKKNQSDVACDSM